MGLLLPLLALLASQEPQVPPDFTASTATVSSAKPRAGDVIRYEIKVTNRGGPAGTSSVTTELPRAFLIDLAEDCAAAKADPSTRHVVWYEGPFATGETRTCVIRMLSRKTAAGTLASAHTSIATFRPETYWRYSAEAELDSVPAPPGVRLGSIQASRAGLVVLGLIGLFIIGIPVLALLAGSPRGRTAATRAWCTVVVCMGFLGMFAGLAYDDYRAATLFAETQCTIFGSDGTFALRYTTLGVETFSSGFGTATRLGFGRSRRASGAEEFRVGSTHPCWYDPEDVKTVLLDRSPGGAYFFGLIPLATLFYALALLWSALGRS